MMSARNPHGLHLDSGGCPLYPTRPDPTRPVFSTYVPARLSSACGSEIPLPNPKSSGTYTRERATFGFGEAPR